MLLGDCVGLPSCSRDALEDLLNDRQYFDAVFYALPQVKAIQQAQLELGKANEALART